MPICEDEKLRSVNAASRWLSKLTGRILLLTFSEGEPKRIPLVAGSYWLSLTNGRLCRFLPVLTGS